ncbi:hypothetical protein KAFR_0A05770 [Kazachstania africana CBS 2517]|uniref:Cell division control protein 73 C-terminal domain-containing protein n=1 Tax=Kazachstania africana (strain ATCC 22294 / BCRC 22015 / CBS 2517 / CECT 1963 / NBRC 1671 / NRRL Y-8276) TaxID=1071382 RepID=H2ANR2_KAZAF|nr:hypothetical protein KAFR_0A05770 [Kazachstania africana CBS 2517]CCF56012.1 hypothetical protein KAFR_0A05770 [Kazachstania africana CBS 2517]
MTNSILNKVREHLKNGDKFSLLHANNENTDDIGNAEKISFANAEEISLKVPTEFEVTGNATPLKVIIHCWMHKDSSAADYLADCQKKQLTNISFLQRTDLLNWLSGEADTSRYLTSVSEKVADEAKISTESKDESETRKDEHIKDISNSDPILAETMKHERVLLDHNSSLRGSKPIDFGYLIKDAELKLVQSMKSSMRSKTRKTDGHVSKTANISKQVSRKDPIILIPSAASSILTISNIKKFLEESQYVTSSDFSSSLQNDLVTIEKKFDRITRPIRFIVVNNTRMFTKPEYWDRVVAIFTTGHSWQFNSYQWNTPQELFQRCKGYYFYFNGDEVPQHVQQWNVQRMALDKNKRFKDVEVVRYFWNSLEKELISKGYH